MDNGSRNAGGNDGRVRVAVRIRPLLQKELAQGQRASRINVDESRGLVHLNEAHESLDISVISVFNVQIVVNPDYHFCFLFAFL